MNQPRHFRGTGEHDARRQRRSDKCCPRLAVARQKLHGILRNPCLKQQAHALRGDQRRFFSGLCENRIAGNQRRRHLTDEDGEREVPRADADDRAKRRFAGLEIFTGFPGIVPQEVDRLTHLGNGVRHGFAGFAHYEAEQCRHFGLHGVCCAFQAGGAFVDRG